MPFSTVGVVGTGTMGQGIAHVCALAGQRVRMLDADAAKVEGAIARIGRELDAATQRPPEKGGISPAERDAALANLAGVSAVEGLAGVDVVVEAIPERLEWKQDLFRALAPVAPNAVYATNTSSLSIAAIATAAPDPTRVIGTHFFNPVPRMKLLELIVHDGTAPEVLAEAQAWGAAIGKTTVLVRDVPGFATSRLGVCIGMEAIRMVEQGVASAADIDTAMRLGYGFPVGPLELSDMVGLDVRLMIGEYLARELANPAFEPPALMRTMVAEGKLGKKVGQGFYAWDASGKRVG